MSQGNTIFTAIDQKPKGKGLVRLSNIASNPHVAFIVDKYLENWEYFSYLLIHGDAELVKDKGKARHARTLLSRKYPQYRQLKLGQAPVIALRVRTSKFWQFRRAWFKGRREAAPRSSRN